MNLNEKVRCIDVIGRSRNPYGIYEESMDVDTRDVHRRKNCDCCRNTTLMSQNMNQSQMSGCSKQNDKHQFSTPASIKQEIKEETPKQNSGLRVCIMNQNYGEPSLSRNNRRHTRRRWIKPQCSQMRYVLKNPNSIKEKYGLKQETGDSQNPHIKHELFIKQESKAQIRKARQTGLSNICVVNHELEGQMPTSKQSKQNKETKPINGYGHKECTRRPNLTVSKETRYVVKYEIEQQEARYIVKNNNSNIEYNGSSLNVKKEFTEHDQLNKNENQILQSNSKQISIPRKPILSLRLDRNGEYSINESSYDQGKPQNIHSRLTYAKPQNNLHGKHSVSGVPRSSYNVNNKRLSSNQTGKRKSTGAEIKSKRLLLACKDYYRKRFQNCKWSASPYTGKRKWQDCNENHKLCKKNVIRKNNKSKSSGKTSLGCGPRKRKSKKKKRDENRKVEAETSRQRSTPLTRNAEKKRPNDEQGPSGIGNKKSPTYPQPSHRLLPQSPHLPKRAPLPKTPYSMPPPQGPRSPYSNPLEHFKYNRKCYFCSTPILRFDMVRCFLCDRVAHRSCVRKFLQWDFESCEQQYFLCANCVPL